MDNNRKFNSILYKNRHLNSDNQCTTNHIIKQLLLKWHSSLYSKNTKELFLGQKT